MKRTHSMPKKYKDFILTFPKKTRNENEREAELLNVNDENELRKDHNTKTKKCKKDNLDEMETKLNNNSYRDGDCLLDQKIETKRSSYEYEEDSLDDEKVNLNITKGSNGREGKENTASLDN